MSEECDRCKEDSKPLCRGFDIFKPFSKVCLFCAVDIRREKKDETIKDLEARLEKCKEALKQDIIELVDLGTDQVVTEKIVRLEKQNAILLEAVRCYDQNTTNYSMAKQALEAIMEPE